VDDADVVLGMTALDISRIKILMTRASLLLALAAVGCSSRPQMLVGNRALLVGVSSDQGWLASLQNDTRYPNGTHTGELLVQPVAGGTPLVLDHLSPGGTFNRGRALWFLGSVTITQEGTPPLPHYWGTLNVWLPGMTTPIKVGANVRDFYPSQDGSSVVFMDFTAPSTAVPGKLVVLSASTCGTGTCMPVTLLENITLAQAAWRISDDGKFVLATVKGASSSDPGATFLVQPATGDVQQLSHASNTRAPMMTPAGDAIAWVEGPNRIMTSATSPTAPAQLPTTAQQIDAAAMVSAHDFVIRVRPVIAPGMFGTPSLLRVNQSGTTALGVQKPSELYISQDLPGVSTNFVFYSTATDATTGDVDLWLLNLAKPAPPVRLATQVLSPISDAVQLSDDGTTAHWLDIYDPMTRLGYLNATVLATPTPTLISANGTSAILVRSGAFEPGSTRLIFINAPDPTSGAGVLTLVPTLSKPTLVEGVGLVNFTDSRSPPLRTYYTQRTGAADDGIWVITQP
jgi:hypothetical protein